MFVNSFSINLTLNPVLYWDKYVKFRLNSDKYHIENIRVFTFAIAIVTNIIYILQGFIELLIEVHVFPR